MILAHLVLIQAILPVGDDRPCQFALTPAVGQPGPALLDDNRPYPGVTVDGLFGTQTQQAVTDFQFAHDLADSKLALPAKLCVAALLIAVVFICLLLRAARASASSLLRIRCARPGLSASLVAVNSAATETLLAQAHGWAATFLCIILIALIATLLDLLTEVFRTVSGRLVFGDPPSQETQPQMRAGHGS